MLRKFFLLLLPVVAIASTTLASTSTWETIRDCRLIPNPSNDGDSFHVMANGRERIFRLYYVDAPETDDSGYAERRVRQQAAEFGISEQATIAVGRKAAALTQSALSRPFSVLTRGENALGNSKLKREYAFVVAADGRDLGGMLLSYGLARSFGKAAAPPGTTTKMIWDEYDKLEARAKAAKVGAWGSDAGVPTRALPAR